MPWLIFFQNLKQIEHPLLISFMIHPPASKKFHWKKCLWSKPANVYIVAECLHSSSECLHRGKFYLRIKKWNNEKYQTRWWNSIFGLPYSMVMYKWQYFVRLESKYVEIHFCSVNEIAKRPLLLLQSRTCNLTKSTTLTRKKFWEYQKLTSMDLWK